MSSTSRGVDCAFCHARLLGDFCSDCGAHAPTGTKLFTPPLAPISSNTPPPSPPLSSPRALLSTHTSTLPKGGTPPPPPYLLPGPPPPLPQLPRTSHTTTTTAPRKPAAAPATNSRKSSLPAASPTTSILNEFKLTIDSSAPPPRTKTLSSSPLPPLPPTSNPPPRPPSLVLPPSSTPKLAWKPVIDQTTGRTFYVNSITGLKTWTMPVELLKQVKPDDKIKLQALSAPEYARWTRISLPPPPQFEEGQPRPPPSPLQVEETTESDVPALLKLASVEQARPNLELTASNEASAKQAPPPPKKAAPRRTQSYLAQLDTHQFVPDSPCNSPQAETKNVVSVSPSSSPRSKSDEKSSLFSPEIIAKVEEKLAFPEGKGAYVPPSLPSQGALPGGWLLLKDQNNREYQFRPATGEVVWLQQSPSAVEQEDTYLPPPPEEEEPPQEEEVPGPPPVPQNHKKSSSERLSKNEAPPPTQTKPKAQSLCHTETPLSVIPRQIPKEMQKFIEEVMRPKYGQGQLIKDTELLKPFFVYLINIPENLRHVVFHEFFLGVFWREEILEQLLNFGNWKQWLLILIAEATVSHHEILEYVLMTLIEMFYYFFHKFSPQHNGIRQVRGNTHLLLDFMGNGTSRSMADFLQDALTEIDKQSDKIVSFKALSGLNLRVCSWDRKPAWARPDFTSVEWPNLIACVEAQEEYLFFPLPKREFCMPEGGTEFLGLPVLESIVILFEKLKVLQLADCVERAPDLVQLQKYYSTKTAQEYEFFKSLRDFFRFYSQIDCMELQKAGFHVKAKVPPRCSTNEIVQMFLNRRRQYGSRVQKKVATYVSQVNDHYRKIFSGAASLPTKAVASPAHAAEHSVSSGSRNWI